MSLSYFFSDRASDERLRARQTAAAYRANVAPQQDVAARIDALYQAYPHMAPGEIVSLAQMGASPGDPIVQQVADASFEQKRRGGLFDKVGDLFGGISRGIGSVLKPVGQFADAALGEVDESITPATKGTVRTGFVVLESGLQELQTIVRAGGWAGNKVAQDQGDTSILNRLRNIVDPTRWDDQARAFGDAYADAGSSSAREAVSAMLRGDDVDLGSGFLPAGEIEETVRERSNRLTLDVGNVSFGGGNPSITPGRVLAATVSEPGETPYNVISGLADASVAWFADPAAALGGAAKVARASNRAGRAGRAIREGRGLAGAAEELGHLGQFTPVVDRTFQGRAAEGLGDLVDNLTGRVTGTRNTVQPELVDQWLTKGGQHVIGRIAETNDFYDLWQATGKKIPVAMTARLADARTPQEVMDILRPALGAELRQAPEFLGYKMRSSKDSIRLLGDMPGSHIDPGNLDDAVEQIDRWMLNAKVSPELRRSAVDRVARVQNREAMVATLSEVLGDAADDLAERVGRGPDASAKARAHRLTTMYNKDLESQKAYFIDTIAENRRQMGVVVGDEALDLQSPYLFTEYLNSLVPLPEAREVRRATSQLARLVDNPLFEHTTGALDAVQGVWKRVALMRGAYTVRVLGEEQIRMASSGLDSMFAHPISFIAALIKDPEAAQRFATGKLRQTDILGEHFDEAAEYRASLNKGLTKWDNGTIHDRNFVLFSPGDAGYERAWANAIGEFANDPIARRVAEAQGNLGDVKDWFWRRQGRALRKRLIADKPELATQAGSDRYLSTIWEGVQQHTGSDPLLLEAIATGKYAGERIGKFDRSTGRWHFADGFLAHFADTVGPQAVKGQRITQTDALGDLREVWDNGVGFAFSYLMTRPTNYLSRSSSFRQHYWQRIEEMLPYMDEATRAKALKRAEGVVDAAQMKRMRQTGASTNRTITDLADADFVAKAYGLDETKKLLYDVSEKGQFFDTFRLLFPFGEAWKEVVTRWAKIGMENPRAFRRGQQVINGARGNGFFQKDVNGEEVFTYPFSRQISKALIGMPVDINARVSGLSLMTEVLPGVGPVVQVPAAAFLPDGSEWNWAREFVSPFGEQDYSQGFVESFLPGWAKNARQAFGSGDDRQRANTVMQVYDYLASTGDYDLSDPKDQARMFDDARSYGSKLFTLRSMTQWFAPSAPIPETLVKGPKGDELLVRREVINDLHKMQDELGYEEGMAEFVDRYGVDFLAATQGMTKSIPPILPVSKGASDWVRDNRGIVDDYKNTWGFFAPSDDTEGIDLTEYGRQIAAGDRIPLTVEQRAALANARVGRYIYSQAEKKVGERPTKAEREWLAAIKERLRADYPGYGQMIAGVVSGADLEDDVIPELQRALADPRLSGTRQAEAVRIYLTARDRALAYAEENYGTKLGSQAAAPLRTWLVGVAQRLAADFPEFASIYDRSFSWEVE